MKGLQRSISRGPKPTQRSIRLDINPSAEAMLVDGLTGIGFGTWVARGLPEGNLQIIGAVASLSFAGSGADANLGDTWAGDYGVGSTPASDGTITGADVDLIPSTALAAATAEVSPVTRAELAAPLVIDNTAGTAEVNVNLLIDDADIGADDIAITVTGSINISYVILGDD